MNINPWKSGDNFQNRTGHEYIRNEILKMNIFNSVFVDCTASPAIAELYGELMSRNVSVVTANKIAASSDYQNYLKDLYQI